MDAERHSGLFLMACLHFTLRKRLSGPIAKKDLPVLAESLRAISRRPGTGAFSAGTSPSRLKAVLKDYLDVVDRKVDDHALESFVVRSLGKEEPAARRTFFNELAWYVFDSKLDSGPTVRLLQGLYSGLGVSNRPYASYVAKFRPGESTADVDTNAASPVRRAGLLLALGLGLTMAALLAVVYFTADTPRNPADLADSEIIRFRSIRFDRVLVHGPIKGGGRDSGIVELYFASGTAEVLFDCSGLRFEPQGTGHAAVYASSSGEAAGTGGNSSGKEPGEAAGAGALNDYLFAPLRVRVTLDAGGAALSASLPLGPGNQRGAVEPVGFIAGSRGTYARLAVQTDPLRGRPVFKFTGALADAFPLFTDGSGLGCLATGNMAIPLDGVEGTTFPERLNSGARALIAARVLADLPPLAELRQAFEEEVRSRFRAMGTDILSFRYSGGGS